MIANGSAVPIRLSRGERHVLQARVARARAEQRDVLRARIVLAAAHAEPNARIAARLAVSLDTVRTWRCRFATGRLDGLQDLPRSGRPRVFEPVVAAEVKALACSLPAEHGLPLSCWTCADLAREVIERGVVESLSASTVRRILAEDVIKAWQCRSWIFPRDPDFAVKAGRVLELSARRWKGRRLGADDYVISADENSQLQALRRIHSDLPPGPGQPRRQGVRIRARRHAGLLRRAGRAQRSGHRQVRPQDRHRSVQRARQPGNECRALRQRPPGLLGHRQRLQP